MSNLKTKDSCDDFPSIFMDITKKINFKLAFFLYIAGIIIFSDIFIENVLSSSMVDGICANTKGTMVQLLLLVISYIILDLSIQTNLL